MKRARRTLQDPLNHFIDLGKQKKQATHAEPISVICSFEQFAEFPPEDCQLWICGVDTDHQVLRRSYALDHLLPKFPLVSGGLNWKEAPPWTVDYGHRHGLRSS
jgi:hypothetical protein